MTESHLPIFTAILLLLVASAGPAQTAVPLAQPHPQAAPAQPAPAASEMVPPPALPRPQPNFYRNLIVIDPAHGGPDRGAQLTNGGVEKDVTLAFAQRLRPALVAQGFTVVSTRDSDPVEVLADDQRAGTANHVRPLACLLLHASASGAGVHIATSSLSSSKEPRRAQRWSDAQAASIEISLRLSNEIGLALVDAHLPVVLLRASVPPVDNLTCAAAVIEVAPLAPQGGSASPPSDAAYQQKIAEAIALGLASFRTRNAPPPPPLSMPGTGGPARPNPLETKPAAPQNPKPIAPESPKAGAPR